MQLQRINDQCFKPPSHWCQDSQPQNGFPETCMLLTSTYRSRKNLSIVTIILDEYAGQSRQSISAGNICNSNVKGSIRENLYLVTRTNFPNGYACHSRQKSLIPRSACIFECHCPRESHIPHQLVHRPPSGKFMCYSLR